MAITGLVQQHRQARVRGGEERTRKIKSLAFLTISATALHEIRTGTSACTVSPILLEHPRA
jgi:hypothetical protein